jgi:quinoprotein dehydrogenase-associated probable ABC transporter substrate-binding protein
MIRSSSCLLLSLCFLAGLSDPSGADELRKYTKDKNFDELSAAEHTAARRYARTAKIKKIRVCADPGNMPQSNNKREGYQNKIIKILAEDLGGKPDFFWRPYHERGLTRETFQNNECDVLMDMPYKLQALLTTEPVYKTTYVFAYRGDRNIVIDSFDDPKLRTLRVGVFQHSGLREALERRGIKNLRLHIIAYDTDLRPEAQPWQQVQEVIDGKLDIAGVWGPFAGWLQKMRGAPIVLQPVNLMDDEVPLEFELAIGMQHKQVVLKYMLDWAIQRKRKEIAAILREYGVPLLKCAKCAVDGDLPAHGSYYARLREVSQDRFLKQAAPFKATDKAAADQIVTQARVEKWLAEGADPTEELQNALIGNDKERVEFLIDKGADVNARDPQGLAPLHTVSRNRNSPFVALLVEHGADVNARDSDGFTPLLHAINRNHVPTIEMLAKKGADLELPTNGGIRPLTWAIGDGKYFAAKALIDSGANANSASGEERVTPLMSVATQRTAQTRVGHIAQGPAPLELARALLKKGADVNASSKDGVTALMVAAGHNNAPLIGLLANANADLSVRSKEGLTALEIAERARAEFAIGSLKLLARPVGGQSAKPRENGAQH